MGRWWWYSQWRIDQPTFNIVTRPPSTHPTPIADLSQNMDHCGRENIIELKQWNHPETNQRKMDKYDKENDLYMFIQNN